MNRPIRLTAIVAALFALQAPLCAFACLDGPGSVPDVAHQAERPCHGASSDSEPASAPSSQEDCGCSDREALPSGQIADASWSAAAFAFVPTTPPWQPAALVERRTPAVPRDTDLPPPDILLQGSTLLL